MQGAAEPNVPLGATRRTGPRAPALTPIALRRGQSGIRQASVRRTFPGLATNGVQHLGGKSQLYLVALGNEASDELRQFFRFKLVVEQVGNSYLQ